MPTDIYDIDTLNGFAVDDAFLKFNNAFVIIVVALAVVCSLVIV